MRNALDKLKPETMKYFLLLASLVLYTGTYAQVYDDYIGAGHAQGISATSSDPNSNAMMAMDATGLDLDLQTASRFLARSSMGFTMEEVQSLAETGIEPWIDAQFDAPVSSHTQPTIDFVLSLLDECVDSFGEETCEDDFMPIAGMWRAIWWDNVMKGEDQLRQRVAMALSEILVLSSNSQLLNRPDGLANYYDILVNNAFGNYRDILMEMTLHPAMGSYLSHLNNPMTVESLNIRPDENFAREVMQLFTIGLYQLQPNGERKVNMSTGQYIPSYRDKDIRELAKVFTGLGGGKSINPAQPNNIAFGKAFNRISVTDPMVMFEEWHEQGEKTIVGNHVIPAGQSGMQDIEEAIDVLFQHDNTGPFVCRQLIQRMVKSNPTPFYIERVANVFADNGNGVRGDMKAVVKAILTDAEAYECYWQDDITNGMLRSPLLRYTQMMKGLKAETGDDLFRNNGASYEFMVGQNILASPTVFNFYAPDYVPNAEFAYEGLVGPEFQILTSGTSSNYVNYMLLALMGDYLNDRFGLWGQNNELQNFLNGPDAQLLTYDENKEKYEAYLADPIWEELAYSPYDLVDYLDILLTNGSLREETKLEIVQSLTQEQIFTPEEAKYYAVFRIMIDPDFVVMK